MHSWKKSNFFWHTAKQTCYIRWSHLLRNRCQPKRLFIHLLLWVNETPQPTCLGATHAAVALMLSHEICTSLPGKESELVHLHHFKFSSYSFTFFSLIWPSNIYLFFFLEETVWHINADKPFWKGSNCWQFYRCFLYNFAACSLQLSLEVTIHSEPTVSMYCSLYFFQKAVS